MARLWPAYLMLHGLFFGPPGICKWEGLCI